MTYIVQDNHYVKGALSGMCGVLISHPVDSIKTHMQIYKNLSGLNYKHLYRGISSPLFGVGLEKALVFGTYNICHNKYNMNIPMSGAFSGFVASLIVTPYERIKILHQNQTRIIWKECITPKFLFKGLSVTFTREVPGFAIYFSTYEYLKNKINKLNILHESNMYIGASFINGGIAGSFAWLFIYPQDRIKTIIQSKKNEKINILELIKSTYNNGNNSNNSNNDLSQITSKIKNIYFRNIIFGIRHFYSGFSIAIARAFLLHSGTFSMMEILNKK